MFSNLSKKTLLKASLFKNNPVYVQFYVTARCNLTCEQCNIIYANSDVRECTLDEVKKIADNFAKMGVAIVLLTGGEPFARKDLPEIIHAFESRGVHVRMQTNGFASEEQIHQAIEAGGKDISISLDSLNPIKQDKINGEFDKSWHQALKAMSLFTKYLPTKDSFASLGCVLQPYNVSDIEDVIRFGSEASWYTSLVPAHVTDYSNPLGFRTFDSDLKFKKNELDNAFALIERVREMRKLGFLLYDSDQYLDDIKRFISEDKITWREKNNNICDSPNLYFAILPNGEFAPCCDFRVDEPFFLYDKNFVEDFKSKKFKQNVNKITTNCDGCMYGSYPEITISMRYLAAKIQRAKTFFLPNNKKKNWPLSYENLLSIAEKITNNSSSKFVSRKRKNKFFSIKNNYGKKD
jgi:MoaA/NifB/PqqE/SkfB family radical SAM enzyme